MKCIGCSNPCRRKYCSLQCQQDFYYRSFIDRWKNGGEHGRRGTNVSRYIRRYLFEKYNNRCCKCGWSEVNLVSCTVPLVVNHIDGDYRNCTEGNLELLCPNCDSLSSTYKVLNRGHGRYFRLERYRAGKSF